MKRALITWFLRRFGNTDYKRFAEYAIKVAALLFVVITGFSWARLYYVIEEHDKKKEQYEKWKREKVWNQLKKE